ncbi:epoxide hydrolase family protein [Stackebrandtia nassauensis]|uniref:Epoxide hydrolase domain protein n=1 Tax=Stackebrandtia nassauensis (strain DSM 44728 / CIP 108903 / NRRL B-16338 / NBRC 102104 / LLR-40K-21) TaxID=446470 RepID=D3PUN6_STANL|nr:epoxide hydrolase family protein [Stackebrandtia nassauensis]ADD43049.1 Epoxide hydrolase domain protein [Stackebrandtia nassauensis DSM 44728]
MTQIRPFRIEIPQADLDDLNDRLARTRFTNELPPAQVASLPTAGPIQPGWQHGVPLSWVQDLVKRWRDDYDWRAWETKLNSHPHFITEIDGQDIHFVHVRSANPDAVPLILTHGWPNTFVEYFDLIDALSPDFHLVIPDLPGFGFSGPTNDTGWSANRVAKAWAELMSRLGYQRYGVHGNDAGAIVAPILGMVDAAHVIGVHVTQIFSFPKGDPGEFDDLSQDDIEYMQFVQGFLEYAIHDRTQQAQPQTLAHALADSPAGQLAWIGQLLGPLDPDIVLTNATIYWLTNTAASAARFYYENHHDTALANQEPTTTPIGLAGFAYDMKSIRKFAERDHKNIVAWSQFDRGSHWAAHDAGDLLAGDIRKFFTEHVEV